ncbi:MAG: DNA topoisomerase III, partial [Oscillospiraceae bacterium]|nr:DNA topoisomerase III [Oscillospiraceae bacterium]
KKVTDQTAIIPTIEVESADLSSVPEGEYKILCLIANRMLCAMAEPYIYETVTADISCGGYSFTAKGRKTISGGFKDIDAAFRSFQKCREDSEKEDILLSVSENQTFNNAAAEITEHYTQPPKHFTEDTLLSAMERAGTDEITEEVERSGLGTPATRAGIIEKLTKSGFIKRDKRNLVVTDSGTDLISVMPDIVKSAKMTADWENNLSLVAQGRFTSEQFMADISKLTDDIIAAAKSEIDESKITPRTKGEVIGVCPRCGKNVIITPKAYSCEDRDCGFAIWKNDHFFEASRRKLTKEMVAALLKSGKIEVQGLYSQKAGRNYDATVCLNDTGKFVNFKLEFAPRKVKKGGKC